MPTSRIPCAGVWLIFALAITGERIPAQARLLSPSEIDALPSKPADARIPYGSGPDQFGDLRIPPGPGPFPLAIVIHGGCFLSKLGTVKSSAALADALRDAGIATWNVEYRRVDSPGGGWPGTFLDIGAAADHISVIAQKYPIDQARIVAVGHSAGGALALWLAARAKLPSSSLLYAPKPARLRGVVALGSDGDLPPVAMALSAACGAPVVNMLFGGSGPAATEHIAHGNPAELLPLGVRQILIAGTLDPFETPALRDGYAAKARKAGDQVETVSIENAGHFEVVAPASAAWPTVRDRILEVVGKK